MVRHWPLCCVSWSGIIVQSKWRGGTGRNAILVIGDEARTWFMLTVVSLDTDILIGVTALPSFSLQPLQPHCHSHPGVQNQNITHFVSNIPTQREFERRMRCGEMASVNRVTSCVFIVLFGSLGPMTILCRNLEHK